METISKCPKAKKIHYASQTVWPTSFIKSFYIIKKQEAINNVTKNEFNMKVEKREIKILIAGNKEARASPTIPIENRKQK